MSEQPSTEDIRMSNESEALAREIEERLIIYASPAARMEWDALRARWPWSGEPRSSAEAAADDEPAVVLVKVRRFKAILGSLSEGQSASA
jgi:hypothetical protein